MNRLDLDFAPRNARFWWARAGLALRTALAGALMTLAAGLWWWMALHTERLQLQAALRDAAPAVMQGTQDRAPLAAKGAQALDALQTKAMNQALQALNRPWSALWDALERVSSAPGVQVAILEMRPDAASDQDPNAGQGLRLLAESKDSAHMLGFMRQLRAEPFFVSAVLSSHQVNAQDPNKPLRFEVNLRWAQAAP
jgi:Tfp pilus assembly protein PilN